MSGGGSAPSAQTVTTSQQIPLYEQQFSQENQGLARSLGSQSYPYYQAPLVANFTPAQAAGQEQAVNAAGSYQPLLNAGVASTAQGMSGSPYVDSGTSAISQGMTYNPLTDTGSRIIGTQIGYNPVTNGDPGNAGTINRYMNPYVQASLAPQIMDLQTQLAQQRNQLGAQATQSGAFGDARQGAQQALDNFYGNQALSGIVSQGYNTAYNQALQTAQNQQQLGMGEQAQLMQGGNQLANIGMNQQNMLMQGGNQLANIGMGQQNLLLQGGNQFANMAGENQSLGLTGAGATYNVGQQQQQQVQQALNTAYQQYQNAVQWPYQMLNVQESALSNSPYNMTNQVTLPNANQGAQNLGMFASLAGLLGGSTTNNAPFGGQAYNPSGQTRTA